MFQLAFKMFNIRMDTFTCTCSEHFNDVIFHKQLSTKIKKQKSGI